MTIWEIIALAKAGKGAKSMLHFKGSVLNESALPDSGNEGDTYLVDSEDSYFAWDGEGWTDIGQILTMDDVAALFDQVEDAGDEQVARIAAKGQEVEESIPEDYRELSEDVGELKSAVNDPVTGLDSKAPVIIDTASGAIARFEDGADGMPLKKLTVNIEPVQAGSGDPSPTNVRPISGWTGCNVTRTGKNLLNTSSLQTDENLHVFRMALKPNTNYTASSNIPGVINGQNVGTLYICNSGESPSYGINAIYNGQSRTTTTLSDGIIILFYNARGFVTDWDDWELQVEAGSAATSYQPFGSVIPISWQAEAGTVPGGTIDWIAKKLKIKPYYASYNGEPLVGPWISSMDVYATDTTPTIGAQVVDMGGSETISDLTAVPEIDTLYGTNNIWADCGPVSVNYPADTKLYIDNKIAAAIAAAMNA